MKSISHLAIVLVVSLAILTVSTSLASAHMILRAPGAVQLKRGGSYSLAVAGDIVKPGDILEPKQGDVTVFCDNVKVGIRAQQSALRGFSCVPRRAADSTAGALVKINLVEATQVSRI